MSTAAIPLTPFWAAYLTVLSFVFGACVGSFLNVCIYRIPRDESVVHPRSHCPNCNKLIAWYDNIPLLSYILLRAKCRHCGQHIIVRYFLVETLTGLLFVFTWNRYGLSAFTPIYWLVLSGLILATFVDFEHMIIPDRVSLGGILAGVALSAMVPALHGAATVRESVILSAIGVAAGSGSLWAVGILGKLAFKKDAMGMGDVKLLGALGAFLGWQGVLFIIMISSLLGSAVGVALLLSRQKELQSRIPFGPYLAAAAAVWILGGSSWWLRYLQWMSGQ